MGEPQTKIDYLPLSSFQSAIRNPKTHNLDQIAASIYRFGFNDPVAVNEKTGRLVEGHGRLDALQMCKDSGRDPPKGVEKDDKGEWLVPTLRGISFDTDKEAEAYLLAHNQTTISGGYDESLLSEILKEHEGDLTGLGFTDTEVVSRIKDDLLDIPNQVVGFTVATEVRTEAERDRAKEALKGLGFNVTITANRSN